MRPQCDRNAESVVSYSSSFSVGKKEEEEIQSGDHDRKEDAEKMQTEKPKTDSWESYTERSGGDSRESNPPDDPEGTVPADDDRPEAVRKFLDNFKAPRRPISFGGWGEDDPPPPPLGSSMPSKGR